MRGVIRLVDGQAARCSHNRVEMLEQSRPNVHRPPLSEVLRSAYAPHMNEQRLREKGHIRASLSRAREKRQRALVDG